MKRVVLCVTNPQDFIDELDNYSLMIVNPASTPERLKYLFDKSDYSLLITDSEHKYRDGGNYHNERLLWYTSGTTGDSKFCSFSQEQLDLLSQRICQSYDITANDRYTGIMGLWHAHGQGFYWATKLAKCERSFISVKDIKKLEKNNPTFITAIPDILKAVLQFDFDQLRFVRSASSALASTLRNDLKNKFQVPVIEAFGMTEALSHCFTNPLHGEQRIGTVGLPDGILADIVDSKLYIKGPTLATPDWYDTGDLATKDEKGYFKILGRHRDQINVRGLKINPVSLETKLKALSGIVDAVVFGSNSVKCLYVGDVAPDLIVKCLMSLGNHCRPKLLKQVDTIPIGSSGKISRSWLDQEF